MAYRLTRKHSPKIGRLAMSNYVVRAKGDVIVRPGARITKVSGVRQKTNSFVALCNDASSSRVLPENTERKYYLVQNKTANIIYAEFNTAATTDSFQIPAGGSMESSDVASQTSVHLLAAAGSGAGVRINIVEIY